MSKYLSEVNGRGGIYAKVVADSISTKGTRLTTMELKYPRWILAELNTHRMFSRNSSSSRAIPVATMLKQVAMNPAMPIHWGKNQAGMQAGEELDSAVGLSFWTEAAKDASDSAEGMMDQGYHKQITNRLLEPFQFMKTVVTSTEWENFFKLRIHPDAQPEIQELASCMRNAMELSKPDNLENGDYHLPYITEDEQGIVACNSIADNCGEDGYMGDGEYMHHNEQHPDLDTDDLIRMSAARCARVSYLNHDKTNPSIEDDLELYNMLATRPYVDKKGHEFSAYDPVHLSPLEHQATPMSLTLSAEAWFDVIRNDCENYDGVTHFDMKGNLWSGNFRDWVQFRQLA